MKPILFLTEALGTNCYIVPTGDGSAAVIDPGAHGKRGTAEGEAILEAAKAAGLEIKMILLTHGHFDHTAGAKFIHEVTGAPVYIHKDDVALLGDKVGSFGFFCPKIKFEENICTPDVLMNDGDVITLGGMKLTVMSTPGHTAGSVCFLWDDIDGENIMFSGDTLFKDSIGRSDGVSGDPEVQFESLDKLKALDKDYVIYPGHGEPTTLSAEKRFNPFLSGI